MTENSPTFQRWVREFRGAQVPKGRLKPCAIRQPSLRDLSCCGRWFPTLKRWAIIACPSGTKTWPGFAGILWDQILAALDILVRQFLARRLRTRMSALLRSLRFARSLRTTSTIAGRRSRNRTARSVWSAWSLLPLSGRPCVTTAPASWTHSKRFAWQFNAGWAGWRSNRRSRGAVGGKRQSPMNGSRPRPRAG